MKIDNILYDAAVELAEKRYPTGWSGAAAIRTETGRIITSVAPEVVNDCLNLCMEIGAFLEANKLEEKITHSLCLSRESENDEFQILTSCGVCQERLNFWGKNVLIAVSNPDNKLAFKTLQELQPHHWSSVNK